MSGCVCVLSKAKKQAPVESYTDQDIPTEPLPPYEDPHVAAKDKSNEVRIGPMTRARAKLLEQQVNSLLAQPNLCYDENFILPKSMHLCMIRFEGQLDMEAMKMDEELAMEAMELNKELDMEDKQLDMRGKLLGMMTTSECAREEREAGAIQDLRKAVEFAAPGI